MKKDINIETTDKTYITLGRVLLTTKNEKAAYVILIIKEIADINTYANPIFGEISE